MITGSRAFSLLLLVFVLSMVFGGHSYEDTRRPHETESFREGEEAGKRLRETILNDPGRVIFGPAVGQGEFRTFAENPEEAVTFSASVLGNEAYAEFNRIRVCVADVTDHGIVLLIETAAGSHSVTAVLVGDNGFATKTDNDPDWLSPGTSYYFWVYNSSNGEVSFDEGAAHAAAREMGVSIYEALGAPICVAPRYCPELDVNTVVLNLDLILAKIGNGILSRIHQTDPNALISRYSGEDVASCISYSILKPTDPDDPGALRCWMGPKGTLPTCESIRALEERGENFNRGISNSVLSPGEAVLLKGYEENTPFYKDENLEIKSPYSLISDRAEGTALGGGEGKVQIKVCQVTNYPWGSTITGWINNVEGTLCEQGDWSCIRQAVSEKCGAYELNDNCILMEEVVDGVPSIQFGKDTGLGRTAGSGPTGGASIRCWYIVPRYQLTPEQQTDYVAFFNAFAPDWVKNDPRFDPNGEDNETMKLLHGENNWLTCGDFQVITRKYYCRDDTEMCPDGQGGLVPCWDKAEMEASIQKSLQIGENLSSIYDPGSDVITGTFGYASGSWIPRALPLEDVPGFMNSDNSNCPDEEKTCTVAWCGDERVMQGDGLPGTGCLHIRKEVRQCEVDRETGQVTCPLSAEESARGAWILSPCACKSFLGEALGYLAMLRTISHDVKCGDEYTDDVTNQLKQMEEDFYAECEEEVPESKVTYVCGKEITATEETEWLVCQPKAQQRAEPFSPIKVALWANTEYRCQLTNIKDGEWGRTMDFGYMTPFPKWFDYCVDTYRDAVQTYMEEGVELNRDYPPSGLCDPSLAHRDNYYESRPVGCGYDPWEIRSGPSRSNVRVALHPGSEYPFGYVSLSYSLFREYDCYKTGLDCNYDRWLDFFSCAWRDEGWDCSGDCIKDNNYTYCPRVSGWDCHKYDGCDRKEYDKCEYRSAGYDYNDDCRRDSSNSRECSDRWFVPPSKRRYRDCGTTSCYRCTGCGTKRSYSCNCRATLRYRNFCYKGPIYLKSSSYSYPSCNSGDGRIATARVYYTSGDQCRYTYYSACCPQGESCSVYFTSGSCSSGYNSVNYAYSCSRSCQTCYECWEKVSGNYVQAGYYCGSTGQYGCQLSGPKDCKYVNGYDCGRNGGPDANQSPDGCIDNNYRYCCHVAQGWDCSSASASTSYIRNIRDNLSNDRIIAGHCNVPKNLADSECGITRGARRQYRCSRKDHPGMCCSQSMSYAVNIKIENHNQRNAGHYRCRALDDHFSPPVEVDRKYNDEGIVMYDNPATEVNDEARFITEGCREQYNRIYFSATASDQLGTVDRVPVDPAFYEGIIPVGITWKYIAYEDLIKIAAEENCQWRDYLKKCYCTETGDAPPVLQDQVNRYIFYEDLMNPEIEGL